MNENEIVVKCPGCGMDMYYDVARKCLVYLDSKDVE